MEGLRHGSRAVLRETPKASNVRGGDVQRSASEVSFSEENVKAHGPGSTGQAGPSFPNKQRLVLRQSVLVRLPPESPLWLFLLWCLWLWLPQVTSAQPASLPRGSSGEEPEEPGCVQRLWCPQRWGPALPSTLNAQGV